MNHEENNRKEDSADSHGDLELDMALRHFRESVHAWSHDCYQDEFARARAVSVTRRSGWWLAVSRPVVGWGVAAVIAVSAVALPVGIARHHEHEKIEQARQAALEAQRQHDEALRKAADSINDEELLSHVDTDVAQATPDAMEPLASLMSDSE